jgi:hypothetical protein
MIALMTQHPEMTAEMRARHWALAIALMPVPPEVVAVAE